MRASIVGFGNIGRALARLIESRGYPAPWIVDVAGAHRPSGDIAQDWRECLREVDVLFLCVATRDRGEAALAYVREAAAANVPVVTCEKTAAAHAWGEVGPLWEARRLGIDASLGGGTRFLSYLRSRDRAAVTELRAVVNGTLNFVLSSGDRSSAAEGAIRLGYAEPGATDLASVVGCEIGDAARKLSIALGALAGVAPTPIPGDLSGPVRSVSVAAAGARLYVAASRNGLLPGEVTLELAAGDWRGGLVVARPEDVGGLAPAGVTCAFEIEEAGQRYRLEGPGAGAEPTARAMLLEAEGIRG